MDIEQAAVLERFLERLASGEPLAYLIGKREFYGLDFIVTPDVLVPRPETELMVEFALVWLRNHPERLKAADVGTGSGCIAVALAKNKNDIKLIAVDRSYKALLVAQQNARSHQITQQINFVQADLLTPLAGPFDLLCANLPYIPSRDVIDSTVGQHEPRTALDGGTDGLEFIRRFINQLPSRLTPGGLALLEIEYRQGAATTTHCRTAFPNAKISILRDLAGLDRLLAIEV